MVDRGWDGTSTHGAESLWETGYDMSAWCGASRMTNRICYLRYKQEKKKKKRKEKKTEKDTCIETQ